MNLIVGPPKTYKSFLAIEIALSIASGTPAFEMFPVFDQRRVLYVQEESSRGALWRRITRMLRGREIDGTALHGMFAIATNTNFMLDDVSHIQKLIERGIQEYGSEVVILDPLREMHTKNENAAEEMLPLLKAMKALRDQHGVTIIVVHHNNKNPDYSNPADSIRGTTAIWGAMDGGIFVGTTKDDKQSKVSVVLKEGGECEPFFVSIESEANEIRVNAFPINEEKKLVGDTQIIAVVERFPWAAIKDLAKELDMSERRLRPRLTALAGQGKIQRTAANARRVFYAGLGEAKLDDF